MSESTDTHTLRSALAAAALFGRGSDSMLAHISPREAKLLKAAGGSGARNPKTGLLEFDEGGESSSGPPQPAYGPGSQSGLYAFGPSIGTTGVGGYGQNTFPAALTATSPTDFTPLAPGANVPSYVTGDQGRATELAAQQSGGIGFDVGSPTLGTFNVNGQQNYGFQFGNGLFAPAYLPTTGETPTALNAQQQSGLYPVPLAGETLQNLPGLPTAWTDTNNTLTPTAGALSDAAFNLPGETRAINDTKPDPWAMLGLLGPAIAAGPVIGGAIAGLEAGALGAGVAGAGAGAVGAADATPGLFDLSTLLGTSPDVATALTTGDVSGLAAGAGAAGAGAAAPDLFDLNTLLGTGNQAATDALTTGDVSGLAGLTDASAGGLGTASTLGGDNSVFLGAASQASDLAPGAINSFGDVNLAAPGLVDPTTSGLLGISGPTEVPGFSAADTGGGGFLSGVGNAFSDVTDPINKFVNSNSGLFKALGLGASALSLGGDLMKGNKGVTGLTGGSQLNALAGQLATPGGINPQQSANLAGVEQTAAQSGATLQNYLTTGTLPPAVQSQVDQATQAAITNIKAGYAARGIPANSSMEIQDINTAKQNALASAAGLMQQLSTQGLQEQQLAGQTATQLISSGLSGAGISEQIYQTLLQADQNQQAQTGQAIANLARALAGGTTIKLGGTTTV